jgi:4-amino-4-deoxy-L-arabinose transferase-like glycosyltransferase
MVQRQGSAALALAAILGLTALRLVLAVLDRTELSTDEAQYWAWGQVPAFGYFSKPPLIAWIIAASTDLLGQSVAAVRLPAPLIHGATALVLYGVGRRMASPRVAMLAAMTYLTTPAVALGSALMTTDTPMLLAAAVALAAQTRLSEARDSGRSAPGLAALLGLALGLSPKQVGIHENISDSLGFFKEKGIA